jgi:hypothetical protein
MFRKYFLPLPICDEVRSEDTYNETGICVLDNRRPVLGGEQAKTEYGRGIPSLREKRCVRYCQMTPSHNKQHFFPIE